MPDTYEWQQSHEVKRFNYICGHCGDKVGPDRAYFATGKSKKKIAFIFICPSCTRPTFIDHEDEVQIPPSRYGRNVKGITDAGVESLYDEARDCTSVGAYTAAVLIFRKILMNLAVQQGAEEGKQFVSYIEFLDSKGYVPQTVRNGLM